MCSLWYLFSSQISKWGSIFFSFRRCVSPAEHVISGQISVGILEKNEPKSHHGGLYMHFIPSESSSISQCAVRHEIVCCFQIIMQCSFFFQPVFDDEGLQMMSKYLQDNWTVFEGEKIGLKAQETQFLQLKPNVKSKIGFQVSSGCRSHSVF